MNDIVNTLKVMCNPKDPQDQKLLLLAELVKTKCEALATHQTSLRESLDRTNEKLDRVTDLLEKMEADKKVCPVYMHKGDFEKVSFILRYPRLSFLMLIGIVVLIGGLFGTSLVEAIRLIFGI